MIQTTWDCVWFEGSLAFFWRVPEALRTLNFVTLERRETMIDKMDQQSFFAFLLELFSVLWTMNSHFIYRGKRLGCWVWMNFKLSNRVFGWGIWSQHLEKNWNLGVRIYQLPDLAPQMRKFSISMWDLLSGFVTHKYGLKIPSKYIEFHNQSVRFACLYLFSTI